MTDATPSFVSLDDVQKLVDEQLARVRAEHDAQIEALRAENQGQVDALTAQLIAANRPPNAGAIPWNAGGIGEAIHETWSQHDQAKAYAAEEAAGEALANKAA